MNNGQYLAIIGCSIGLFGIYVSQDHIWWMGIGLIIVSFFIGDEH